MFENLRAFIVRPFGIKKDRLGNDIDFDRVERELIDPALTRLKLGGRTTGEITEAGNIRQDMFQLLLTADLVVADVSVDNTNVFWELGVRHALRDKWTFTLRCEADKYPFDLQTDRYFTYDRAAPAAAVVDLEAALRRTLAGDRADSPVYLLLPDLKPQDPSRFLAVPPEFTDEVEVAVAGKHPGDLNLLAAETDGFPWAVQGLRVVRRQQFALKDHASGVRTWETVRRVNREDIEANLLLATIYQRLWETDRRDADLTRSTQAIQRVIDNKQCDRATLAEAYALLARNEKAGWKAEWAAGTDERDRQVRALGSGYLVRAYENYQRAYEQDLNHFFSGLNAAAMLTVRIELAAALPETWEAWFDDPANAPVQLEDLKARRSRLVHAVELALEAESARLNRAGKRDVWQEVSRADLRCLTGTNPARVAQAYRSGLAGADEFVRDAAGSQL